MRKIPILTMAMLLVSCDLPLESDAIESGGPLQTDRSEYELRRTDQRLEVEIPFTYTNVTGETVFVVHCDGIAPPSLEKRVDDRWVHAWSAVVPQCLSEPIEIGPGATYADTLVVYAGLPTTRLAPQFQVAPVDGVYRLVWHSVVHDYDADRPGFGEPLELAYRVSNSFVLKED